MLEWGLERIGKEVDFVKYIKASIKAKAALKVLFTNPERFLLRNNRKFSLNPKRFDPHTTISSESSKTDENDYAGALEI